MDAQLVDGSNISTYVTLSHCWGIEPAYKTTQENLPKHMAQIRYERLPATFRHAMKITRNLGYRYIWIDALCIIQGSEEDWASEGSKMEAIFSNCVLCISATSGTDSFSGCYSKTATGRTNIDDYVLEIPSVLSTGSRSALYLYYPQPFDYEYMIWPAIIRDSPSTTRGWMLQERLLAPRILHFTSEQLIWECCAGFKSEDGLEPWALAISAGGGGPSHHNTGPKLAHELANASGALAPFEIVWKWYNDVISEHYSKRLLSFGQDKLPAVSGPTRLVARSTKSRYIAGLWECGLCFGLCWRVDAPAPPLPTQEEYRAPSFSWASLDSPVSWEPDIYNHEIPPPLFTVLSLDSEPATSDRFGRVSQAALKVKGRFKQFQVRPSKYDWEIHGPITSDDPNAYFLASLEVYQSFSVAWLDTEPQDETLLGMLVCEAHKGVIGDEKYLYILLLMPAIGRPDVFKRRGLATMPKSEAYDCVAYPGEYRDEIITLI